MAGRQRQPFGVVRMRLEPVEEQRHARGQRIRLVRTRQSCQSPTVRQITKKLGHVFDDNAHFFLLASPQALVCCKRGRDRIEPFCIKYFIQPVARQELQRHFAVCETPVGIGQELDVFQLIARNQNVSHVLWKLADEMSKRQEELGHRRTPSLSSESVINIARLGLASVATVYGALLPTRNETRCEPAAAGK